MGRHRTVLLCLVMLQPQLHAYHVATAAPRLLVQRLAARSPSVATRSPLVASRSPPVAMAAARLDELTVYELKAVCRAKGLKVSGKKAELIARVAGAPPGVLPDEGTTSGRGRGRGRGRGKAAGRGRGRGGRGKKQAAPADSAVTEVAAPVEVEVMGSSSSTSEPDLSQFAAQVAAQQAEVANGATYASAEVLTQREAEDAEDEARRTQRRAQRRAKLSQYFSEEFNSVVGALEIRAGSAYARTFGATPAAEALEPAAAGIIDSPTTTGRRFAWCREYDMASGTGVIIDLEERTEWSVNRQALRVRADLPAAYSTLNAGEFIEYEPNAARELAGGGEPTAGWVCGILGWVSGIRASNLRTPSHHGSLHSAHGLADSDLVLAAAHVRGSRKGRGGREVASRTCCHRGG